MSPRSVFCTALLGSSLLLTSAGFSALWSEHELIGIHDTYNDRQPEVGVDPQGRVWVVWMGVDEIGTHDYEIYWSRRDGEAGWSPRQRVNPNNTQSDVWPRMRMAPDGTPWAVWLRGRVSGGGADLLTSRYVNESWTMPDTVIGGPDIGSATYFGLAPESSSHCWFVYNLTHEVRAREYLGDHFGPVEVPGPPSAYFAWHVDAALGTDGEPWAVWEQPTVLVSHRSPEGVWPPPTVLNPGELTSASFSPSVTVDADGEAWVLWHTENDSCQTNAQDIVFSRTIGGVWQAPIRVSASERGFPCGRDTSADVAAGYGWSPRVVWVVTPDSASVPGPYRELISSGWDSESWDPQSPMHIPDSVEPVEDAWPTVAVGPDGTTWAAWQRAVQGYDIYVSHLLADVIDLRADVVPGHVEISWRVVGASPRDSFVFTVLRSTSNDTVKVGESIRGSRDEYHVTDELVSPGATYSYWIDVQSSTTGEQLFTTNWRTVTIPIATSVEPPVGSGAVPRLITLPNPSAGKVTFLLQGARGEYRLDVFDVRGRRIWSTRIGIDMRLSASVSWPISEARTSGVFLARLSSAEGGKTATSKFILRP
jgi:hypothetical protein